MSVFKDYFSEQAATYAAARPRYPPELFAYLAGVSPGYQLALDCATGSGQAALGLAEHFQRVVATDLSVEQLRHARPHPRVEYRHAPAEDSGLPTGGVDLVMIAQALHWLDIPRFFAEVRRVLREGGVVAISGYSLARVAPEIDAPLDRFYHDTVGPYWTPERRLVEEGYRSVRVPFAEIAPPTFEIALRWTREHLLDYVRSWSATRRYVEARGVDPVPQLDRALREVWPDGEERLVRWPLAVRVGVKE